jgi:hypothetical protein
MARAITSLYDQVLDESGLRTSQFAILTSIRMHGAISMQELAAELGLDPSTMTRTLQPRARCSRWNETVTSRPNRAKTAVFASWR